MIRGRSVKAATHIGICCGNNMFQGTRSATCSRNGSAHTHSNLVPQQSIDSWGCLSYSKVTSITSIAVESRTESRSINYKTTAIVSVLGNRFPGLSCLVAGFEKWTLNSVWYKKWIIILKKVYYIFSILSSPLNPHSWTFILDLTPILHHLVNFCITCVQPTTKSTRSHWVRRPDIPRNET